MATVEDVKVRVSVDGLRQLDELKNKTEAAKTSVNSLATAILGVGFASFVSGALQAADRISDFSDATNISIASLKGLEAAMNASGGSGKNLEKSISALFSAIETANNGSLQARDAFSKVGVSLSDLRNLSEADILQKTLEGLAELPPGAERSAIATQLLSRSFRSVDPKSLLEALDPRKYAESEEATKRAAAAQQKLEESYKALQEGAIRALEPLVRLMGDTALSAENATKIVQGLGIAFAVLFGAQAIASIGAAVQVILKLNTALKATGAAQAFVTALGGPKGIAMVAAAGVAAGAAIVGLNKLLGETEAQGEAASEAVARVADAAGDTTARPQQSIQQARPQAGPSRRDQELDARQRAQLESEKRIQATLAEIEKFRAIQSADEIARIEIERDTEISKARLDILSKEHLSKEQKERELAGKKIEIETRAEAEIAKVREKRAQELNQVKQVSIEFQKQGRLRKAGIDFQTEMVGKTEEERAVAEALRASYLNYQDQFYALEMRRRNLSKDEMYLNEEMLAQLKELTRQYYEQDVALEESIRKLQRAIRLEDGRKTLQQQRTDYQNQINNLLGYEVSELDKVNLLIAQQPDKYKEVGDQLRANAQQQDASLRIIKEFNQEQERQRTLIKEAGQRSIDFAVTQAELISEQRKNLDLMNAGSSRERRQIEERFAVEQKMAQFIKSRMTDQLQAAYLSDLQGDATAEQLQMILDFNEAFQKQVEIEKSLSSIRLYNAEQVSELQNSFLQGWKEAFEAYAEEANNASKQAKTYFDTFARGFEDAIVRAFTTGKLSFKDLVNSLIADFARIQARRMLFNFMSASGFGSLFGGGSSTLAGPAVLGLPGYARGGYLPAGQMGIVGEKGPEIITGPANITPMENLSQPVMVTYNINAVDASSFRALVARDPQFIYNISEQGRRSQPTRRLS